MGLKFKNLVPMINSCLGTEYKADDLLSIGERVWNLERLYSMRTEFEHTDDTLPERFIKEPIAEGPGKGQVSKIEEMLPEYYDLRGWSNDGIPLTETLKSLELED
jgi:aldehyde:ferredoxin oxidoreductase